MKRVIVSAFAIGTVVSLLFCATRNAAQTVEGPFYDAAVTAAGSVSDPWPLVFISGTNTYTVFEPQCDSWDGHQFVGRSAVAVQPYGQAQPTYGVLGFSAITLVNKPTRTVALADVKVTGTDFPSAHGQMQNYVATLRQVFPERAPSLSLDRLEGSLTYLQPQKAERLINTPPKIIIATRPAVLVYLDGPPAWRPVPGHRLGTRHQHPRVADEGSVRPVLPAHFRWLSSGRFARWPLDGRNAGTRRCRSGGEAGAGFRAGGIDAGNAERRHAHGAVVEHFGHSGRFRGHYAQRTHHLQWTARFCFHSRHGPALRRQYLGQRVQVADRPAELPIDFRPLVSRSSVEWPVAVCARQSIAV